MREKPVPLAEPNLEELRKLVHKYIAFCASSGYFSDNDWDHYVAEAAVEAYYGADVWDWINAIEEGDGIDEDEEEDEEEEDEEEEE